MIEWVGMRLLYHYSAGGGTDNAAHGHDHYQIQQLEDGLKAHSLFPNIEARAKAIRLLRNLADSAQATGGDVGLHAEQRNTINALLPRRLAIRKEDIIPNVPTVRKFQPRVKGGGNPYR